MTEFRGDHSLAYHDDGVRREFVCRKGEYTSHLVFDRKSEADKVKFCPNCGEMVKND